MGPPVREIGAALRSRVAVAGRALEATSPLAVLARGYSITRRAGDRRPLLGVDELPAGELLETLLADGRILSRVESTEDEAEGEE